MGEMLGRVEVLRTLSSQECLDLAAMCDERLYAHGEWSCAGCRRRRCSSSRREGRNLLEPEKRQVP
jgi:ubiquitin C-terminal hydrolase